MLFVCLLHILQNTAATFAAGGFSGGGRKLETFFYKNVDSRKRLFSFYGEIQK